MRRLGIVLALLMVACAPKEPPVADTVWFHTEFSGGALGLAGAPSYWDYTDGAPPAAYPDLAANENMEVVSGVLRVTGHSYPPEDASTAACVFRVNGGSAWGDWSPVADKGFIEADIHYTSGARITEAAYLNFWIGASTGGNNVLLEIEADSGGAGVHAVRLYVDRDLVGTLTLDSVTKTTAELVNGGNPIRTRIEWKYGTLTAGPAVASDGWVRMTWDGVVVYEALNEPIYFDNGAEVNRFTKLCLGYYSSADGFDNLKVGVPGAESWVDVPNFKREWIDASQYPGGVARCLCMLWATAAGVNVQARLVSLLADGETVDTVVGTSASVTSQTPVDGTFAVALSGYKRHKLQLTSTTPLTGLWCAPGAKVMG